MNSVENRRTLRGLQSFRLGIIARYSPRSVAIPFATDARLGAYLKMTASRISVNSPLPSVVAECNAIIANNRETLSSSDVDMILADVGTRGEIGDRTLLSWFDEQDVRWLDRVRANIGTLPSPAKVALAQKLAMETGQYALSFRSGTSHLRQPLTNIFLKLSSRLPEVIDNGKRNLCTMKPPRQFVSETEADLMFLTLPAPSFDGMRAALGNRAWREEWIRGGTEFWREFEEKSAGQIHGRTPSKSMYLKSLEQLLRSARKMRHWLLELPAESYIASNDVIETVGSIRPVKKVFTKDLSEIGRGRSMILSA